jgi:AsmA protein
MKKSYRNVGIAVAVIVVILLVLPRLINVNSFQPKIESELTKALGRKVGVGDLSLSILRGSVSAAEISIADDPAFSKVPFLTAKSLKIGVELIPLIFSKRISITGIALDEPSITLLSTPGGKWNISSLATTSSEPVPASGGVPAKNLAIAELRVTDGKLLIGKVNSPAKSLVIDNLNIELKNFSATEQFPFTLTADLPSSGKLELEGKAGPIAPGGTPLQATLKIGKLDLASIGADPSVGLGGIVNLDGTLDSDGKMAKIKGELSLEKLKLSPKGSPAGRPVQVKLATDYDLVKQTGKISTGDVSVGKAVAHLTGNYQTVGDATMLEMKLNAPGLPVQEVESLLPALGVTLPKGSGLKGGTLSASLGISGSIEKPVIVGPVKLENSKLEGFDLGSKLSVLSAFSGKAAPSKDTVIQNASANTRVAPEGTRLDAINVTVPSLGVLTGAGSVSPAGNLSFNMMAELTAAGGVTQRATGGSGVAFKVEGTTSDPKIVPDVGGMAGNAARKAVSGSTGKQGESSKGLGGLLKKTF